MINSTDKKINDLVGLKIKAPNGEVGYWHSSWNSGVWIKKKKTDNHVYPIFVESLDECLNWEILKDEITEENSNLN